MSGEFRSSDCRKTLLAPNRQKWIGQIYGRSALEVLQSIVRGTNRVGQIVKPSDFARGRSDVPMRFEIEVILEDTVYEYTLALELPDKSKELRVLEEKLTVAGRPVYTSTPSR